MLDGHEDREKSGIVRTASPLSYTSVRLPVVVASILVFDIWTDNVKQAYMQNGSTLRRRLYVKPWVVELGYNEILQWTLPLYRWSEAGDH